MNRGIIASPYYFESEGKATVVRGSISLDDIRYYAMYWDKVVIPDSRMVSIRFPDQDVLIETGVITRPVPPSEADMSGNMETLMVEAQAKFAQQLITEDTETDWVLHQMGSGFSLPSAFQAETRTVRVELQRALPVPVGDVHITEILEFKERRRDELMALHQYLDEAYLEVLRSPDPSLARHSQIESLRKTIADLDTVANERWKISKKFDLSAELNLDGQKIMTGVAALEAFNFYTQTGLSIPLVAVAGGVLSLIKLSAKKSMTFEPAKNNIKLGYLSRAQKEAILP